MRAAVLTTPQPIANRPLKIEEIPRPEPAPGYVLLRVKACGVCRTDLHIVEGELPPLRDHIIPGHQIVGEVVAGAGMPIGARVGVSWLGGTDGNCPYCRRGEENLCDAPVYTGLQRPTEAMREFALARADFTRCLLPGALDDLETDSPLLCAGIIIGFRSLRVAGVEHGERVGLFGFGASAQPGAARLAGMELRGLSCPLAASLIASWRGRWLRRPGLVRSAIARP